MIEGPTIEELLAESEWETSRFEWEGTFGDYLRKVLEDPSVSRLSHKLVEDAIVAEGAEDSPSGDKVYGLFEGEMFGLEPQLARLVQYFGSAGQRLEIRKRVLLLLGPPASGKSSIVELIKRALERYTRTDAGALYAIKGCPMQEDPLHLIPHQLRPKLRDEHGIYIEGDLCPRCRYVLRVTHKGRVSEMPVNRALFSEQEAVGIGYYVATSPNPDASLLVGSVDTSRLEGDRLEVAGRAFRLDGEFNVANRGLMELVEIFKADRHLLTTLLGLVQEHLIKMERFGAVYADEVVIGHSNEGDYELFRADEYSEALKDRIIEIRIPYNLRISEEVKIYEKMLRASGLEGVHIPPLTLPMMGVFAVLSRMESPTRQGLSLLNKLRLYDGQMVGRYTLADVAEMKRAHPDEAMTGISPRHVMNRLSAVASVPDTTCVSPFNALDSLWHGLRENVSLEESDQPKYLGFVKDAVEEYSDRAVREVQRAFADGFEQSASELFTNYLENAAAFFGEGSPNEHDMREIEKHVGVADRDRTGSRREIHDYFSSLNRRGVPYDYRTEPRLRTAIEEGLFPNRRRIDRALGKPRFAKQQAEWRRERTAIYNRLINAYNYCSRCAEDLLEFVAHVLKGRPVMKTPKYEGIEWLWNLNPSAPSDDAEPSDEAAETGDQATVSTGSRS